MSGKTSKEEQKQQEINNTPVIGILTLPISNWLGENVSLKSRRAKSYLPSAYVKWIENSGARVVPIQYNATKPILLSYLNQLDGAIICGEVPAVNYGMLPDDVKVDIEVVRWMKAENTIFEFAKVQNKRGTYFPLMGIGMGYEELVFMHTVPHYYSKLTTTDDAMSISEDQVSKTEMVDMAQEYLSVPLHLTKNPGVFGTAFTEKQKKEWSKTPVLYTGPGWGFNADDSSKKRWEGFLEVNATNVNKKLKTKVISLYSFKDYPFYGCAFHPEAVIYNWSEEEIPQTNTAVAFSQKLSELFVNECRKNPTKLSSDKILIYNYTLYSPEKVLKILYPENWESLELRQHFTNSYFFGVVKN